MGGSFPTTPTLCSTQGTNRTRPSCSSTCKRGTWSIALAGPRPVAWELDPPAPCSSPIEKRFEWQDPFLSSSSLVSGLDHHDLTQRSRPRPNYTHMDKLLFLQVPVVPGRLCFVTACHDSLLAAAHHHTPGSGRLAEFFSLPGVSPPHHPPPTHPHTPHRPQATKEEGTRPVSARLEGW